MLLPELLPHTLPAEARAMVASGLLPPIGASPDGMLRRTSGGRYLYI